MKDLDIVTTYNGRSRRFQLLYRLLLLAKVVNNNNWTLYVGYQINTLIDSAMLGLFRFLCPNVVFVTFRTIESAICNSKLRNIAFERGVADFVLFFDLDIFPDQCMIKYIRDQAKQDAIAIMPCVYLTREGSKKYKANPESQKVNDWLVNLRTKFIQHLAIPSSIVCLKRSLVLEINGFDERFVGHGYEDLDFLIRVDALWSKRKYSREDLVDETYLAPFFSIGFRHRLSFYCWDHLVSGKVFVHIWHKNVFGKKEERHQNKERFLAKYYMDNVTDVLENHNREICFEQKYEYLKKAYPGMVGAEFLFHKFSAR